MLRLPGLRRGLPLRGDSGTVVAHPLFPGFARSPQRAMHRGGEMLSRCLPPYWRYPYDGKPTQNSPGQVVTQRFPVLHYGPVPRYESLADCDLRIFGAVEEEVRFTYDQLTALPTTRIVADIHCVTGWAQTGHGLGGGFASAL